MSYARIEDVWEDLAEALVLEQYKESENLKNLIKVFVSAGQPFEDTADRLRRFYDLDEAEGVFLDFLGGARRLPREAGESDADYRERIREDTGIGKAGTPPFVNRKSSILSGDPSPVYFEEENARFKPVVFVYTPNGRQLTRGTVNSLTPAGVLGVPGAALKTATGKTIVQAKGSDTYLLTEDGNNYLTDEEGNPLLVPMNTDYKKILCVGKNKNI